MEISAPGIGSGLDIAGIVDQLVAAERAPVGNRLDANAARTNAELSAIGKLKSALASFRDALSKLTDIDEFQQRTVAFDVEGVLSAAATSAAAPGFYDIEVAALATHHKLASQAFVDTATAIGTGTLTITAGGETSVIDIVDGANTLADIRTAINDADDNPGVIATIVTAEDGAHLVLTSRDTGSSEEITIAASGGDGGLAVFDFDPAPGADAMSQIQAAADAQLNVDGFAITSASNSVAGAIEGVTLDLHTAAPGSPVRLTVGLDNQAAEVAVEQFIEAYNGLIGTISELTAFDPETQVAGPLLGDATTRGIKSALRRELSAIVSGTGAVFTTLSEIGVTTQPNGTIELDTDQLTAAIASDFDAVGRLFASANTGIAVRMDAILKSILDTDGQIETREDALKERLDRIDDQREVLDRRMEAVRQRLQKQFDAMDRLVGQLNNTSAFLNQQLANLPRFNSS
jgi:flagellar hook-associated protein 2